MFDLWPFFSSLLPTFIPLGPRLLISHCHIVTHVLIMLCFPHLTVFCNSNVLPRFPLTFSWIKINVKYCNYYPPRPPALWWTGILSGQLQHEKEPVEAKKVDYRICELYKVGGQVLSRTKASVFYLKPWIISILQLFKCILSSFWLALKHLLSVLQPFM